MLKMVKFVFILLALVSVSRAEQKAELPFKFGLGLGYNPAYMFVSTDKMNGSLGEFNSCKIKGGLMLHSVSAYAYLLLVKNMRIGFAYSSGSKAAFSSDKENMISRSFTALSAEYSLPWTSDWGLSVGAYAGHAKNTIFLTRNGGAESLDGLLSGDTGNFACSLAESSWFVSPALNLDLPLGRFLSFRLGTGYMMTVCSDWTYNQDKSLRGVPEGIFPNSFFIQAGVFLGLFSY